MVQSRNSTYKGTMLRKIPTTGPVAEKISMDLKVPPNQIVTDKFPVLTFGGTPKIDLETWRLRLFGSIQQDIELGWDAFKMLSRMRVTADFHCVTQWSRLDNTWEGVSIREVIKFIKLKPDTKYVMAHCYGGYTTNLDLESLFD